MTSKTFVVLDDDGNDLRFIGNWTNRNGNGWYQGTAKNPPSAGGGRMNFTFEGKQASFLGLQPSTAVITLLSGSGNSVNTTTTLQRPSSSSPYTVWYKSSESEPGTYTINAEGLASGSIDAILVGLDQKTPLLGRTLLVDDDEDTQIAYAGSWTRNIDGFNGKLPASGWAIQNTTHQSSTVGDLLTFRFTGTSLSIYGIFSWNSPSLLSLSYTLDNTTVARSYPVTPSSQEYLDKEGETPNYLFFSYQNLRQGPHTLVINVTDVRDTSFRFDYLTYQPSFADLSSMPMMSANPDVPTNQASITTSAGKPNVGAIAGGIISVLAVLGFIGSLVWLRRRRRRQSVASTNRRRVTPFVDGTRNTPAPAPTRGSNGITPFTPSSAGHRSEANFLRGKGGSADQLLGSTSSKAALREQTQVSDWDTSQSFSPITPVSPFSKSREALRSPITMSSFVSDSGSPITSPSVAPSAYPSKAAFGRASAANNNQGPLPPSYNAVVAMPPSNASCSKSP